MQYRPQDTELTFYLQVYRDPREARWCLTQLRRHYPKAQVLMISDGDDDPRWPRIAKRFNARYVAGQRLYSTEFGGRMLQRMLNLYLENPTDYLIKIDTDTWVHRRLKYMPTGCRVFGTLEWSTWGGGEPLGFPNVQGGFVGYTREAANRICTSNLMLSNRLRDYANTYADVHDIRQRAEKGMVSSDFLTRYACRALHIPCEEFNEIKSQYRGWVQEIRGQYAFTHPHKEVAQRSPFEHRLRGFLPELLKDQIRGLRRWATGLTTATPTPTPRRQPATQKP